MIIIKDIVKKFGKQTVLDGINLNIEKGKTTAIIGPSGTGKSVLLKIITGLLQPNSGEVSIDGQSMTSAQNDERRRMIRSSMGVLFQGAALFDSLNVFDNVAFPLRHGHKNHRCSDEKEIARRCFACLKDVGMEGEEFSLPGEISIGMRKRVGIARALVTNPDVILFDEPNTGLDPQVGQEIYELIKETKQNFNITGIVVSHEIPEVFQVCDNVAMLYDGVVQFSGSVEEFNASSLPVVEQFVGGSIEGPISVS